MADDKATKDTGLPSKEEQKAIDKERAAAKKEFDTAVK